MYILIGGDDIKDNYLVVKSNRFIMNSGYDLSLEEQKIILTLASMVSPDDEDFKPYIFKISDFIELLGVNDPSKYSEVPKITKELMKKVFEIKEGKTIIQTAWLSSVKYEKGSGMVEMTFSNYLKPYMLQLNELYTQYRLKNVLSMKSKYSIRLYEILKSNEFKQQKNITISIDELRHLFKAESNYQRYNDFKRNIIVYSQEELKKYSDISFDFDEVKTGRKVTSLKFKINKNTPSSGSSLETLDLSEKKNKEKTDIDAIGDFISEPISDAERKKIYMAAQEDVSKVLSAYQYYKDVSQKKTINNVVGYLIGILTNGFNEPIKSSNEKSTKDFEEREYDYDDLEKKLLGWK